jgi:rubredoxin
MPKKEFNSKLTTQNSKLGLRSSPQVCLWNSQSLKIKEEIFMANYVCSVCGYVYNAAENGDTPFAQLPEDWQCPLCGVGKDSFEEE